MMAEKCLSSFGKTADTQKSTLNCHSTIVVEHPITLIRSNNNIKIMDHSSEVSLDDATDDSCTIFNRNLIDNCNVHGNNNDKSINIIKNTNHNNHIILNDDIDDDGCGSGSSDDIPSCNKQICNEPITATRNELKNLNFNSTNHDSNIIYLETPVIDENNVCLVGSNQDFEKVQAKPKRLSDEFLSSDDDDIDDIVEDDDKIDIDDISGSSSSTAIKLSTISQELSTKIIPATSTTPAPTSIDDDINPNNNINILHHHRLNKNIINDVDDDNSNANFMPVVVSTSSRDFIEDELNSSSCSNLVDCLKDDESQLLIMNDDDDEIEEPSTSSLSAIDDELCKTNKYRLSSKNINNICGVSGGGGSGVTSSESTVSYYDNDVQSMDAIERRDFEQEQRLTGGMLMRTRSLINSDNKLNMELIKSFHNNNSNDSVERTIASDSKFLTTQREQQLATTPTSSRNCTLRLTKSTAKINLSATLDYLKDNRLEKKEQKLKLIHLQPSTSTSKNQNKTSQLLSSSITAVATAAPITSTSSSSSSIIKTTTVPILETKNLLCGKNNKKQFNILFTNSNSNDSLSSDKSYSTSSNHSLPNVVSSKSASSSSTKISNNNNCTSTSTSGNCKSIIDKTDEIKIKTNNNNSSSNNTTVNNNNSIQNYDLVNSNLYSSDDRVDVSSVSKEYSVDDEIDEEDDDDDEDDDDEDDDEDNENFCCSEQQQKQQKQRINNNAKNIIEIEKFNDNNNITISKSLINKSIINSKSVRFNKKILDIKDSCNYNNSNVFNKASLLSSSVSTQNNSITATTSSSTSANSSSAAAVVSQQSQEINADQQQNIVDNNNFNENPLLLNHQGNNIINESQSQQQQLQHNHDNDFDDETWADCEEGSDEEICTCHNSNLTIDFLNQTNNSVHNEDDLPSKDVDLSSYIQMVSISEDMFLQHHNNLSPEFTIIQRKRKLNDNNCNNNSTNCSINGIRINHDHDNNSCNNESPSSSRKRIALDFMSTPRSSQQQLSNSTIVSTNYSSPSTPSYTTLSRTPRSIIPTKDNPPPELQNWLQQFQLWSPAERLLAVDRLIEHCEPQQVRHMMKVIEPQFQRDFISLLPRELALQVLSYLDPKDLLRAAQTCRSWRFLCDDNLLWKEKCKTAQILTEPTTDRPKRGRAGNMPPISSPWKAAYMRQHIIEMNWRTRPIRDPKILKGHDDHVITCLQFSGNRIVSGSDDNTLKVWSAVSGKCLRTLIGHTGGVWSSQMAGNVIISGSTDRTLKVWDMETGQCIHTLLGHTSTVRCMHLHGKKVVSGSRDATLRVWDIEQGTCLHVLVGHLAAVRCVQYDGKLIVSGAYDYMVKIWHPERQECLHTLQGHTNRVYSLQFDGIHVVSGSLDTSIRVWDAETGNSKHTLMGHQSLTSGMELRSNILVSGNADSTVKVWDITTGQCLQTLSGPNKHQSAVTCLQFNSRFVITSSDDGTVKLWDVKTGEFIRNLVALDSGGSGGVVWRIRANDTKLICAVGSRNGTEETKLMVLDFDVEGACVKCS